MGQRLRIFLSSPGDVDAERLRAHLIIQKLARDYARFFQIEPYLWEYEPMLASGHFQDVIEPPSKFDIVVLVVWSRLGTALPERTDVREYRGIDGHAPVTGTEWEFETALSARRSTGAPDLLAYRRSEVPRTTMGDAAVREQELHQYEALEAFWQRHFEDRGVFLAGCARYATTDEFDRRLELDLKHLIERRIEQLTSIGTRSPGAVWLTGSPFRALTAYKFEDASIFFGRDGATRTCLSRLADAAARNAAFLLVSGASGSGKSSLARAGLLPALAAPLAVQNVGFWRRVVMHPGDGGNDPFLGLARALASGTAENDQGLAELLGADMQVGELAQHLRVSAENPTYLFKKAMGEITAAARVKRALLPHEQVRLVLLVDQFEELFTSPGITAADRTLFIRLLAGLARSEVVWVIATMRSDLRHLATESKEFIALVEAGAQVDLAAPDDAELLEIIRQPAAAAGLTFETNSETGLGLDGVIVKAAAAEPGVLPLLSVVLDELYQRDVAAPDASTASAQTLTIATYHALGELKGAIARRAEETYRRVERQDPQAAAALPDVLRALVTTNDGMAVTGRPTAMDGFPPAAPGRRLIDAFLAQDARLLVAEDGPRGPELRLAHEILLSEWPRAAKQIADDRRDIETRTRLEGLLHRYLRAEGPERKTALLEGLSLAEGVDLVERWKIAGTTDLGAFVAASAAAARWKRQRLLVASIAFMVILAGLAATATWQSIAARQAQADAETERAAALSSAQAALQSENRAKANAEEAALSASRATAEAKRADEALQRRLADESNRVAAVADQLIDDERGALASALVLQVSPRLKDATDRPLTPAVVSALGRALRMDREIDRRSVDGNNILRLAVSADERTAVTGLNSGSIQFWDLPGLVLRKNVKAHDDYVTSIEISPDQQSVLVAGGKVPSVWDLRTRERRFDLPVPDPTKFIKMARYSPDGAVIATGGADNRVLVFDGKDGHLLRTIPGPDYAATHKSAQQRAEQQGSNFGVADPIVAAVAEANFKIFGATTEIAFSRDGKTLAVAGPADPEAAVRLYDVATGKLRTALVGTEVSLMGGAMNYGEALQFSATGDRLAAIAPSGNIQIFDTAKGKLLHVLTTFQTNSILLTGDGQLLISGHQDGSLALWCVSNGQLVATPRNHRASVEYLSFNSDETLFISTSSDDTAAEWAVPAAAEVCSNHRFGESWLKSIKPIATFEGHASIVNRAAFLDNNRKLITVSRDGTLRSWSTAEHGVTALRPAAAPDAGMWDYRWEQSLTFTPDGRRLIVNGVTREKAALWDVDAGTLLTLLDADRVAAAHPGHVISANDTPFTATLFDSETGHVISSSTHDTGGFFGTPSDWSWEISPDGRRAIGARTWLRYFDALNNKARSANVDPKFDWDEDKRSPRVAMDTMTGKEVAELQVEDFKVDHAGFSTDGSVVVAAMMKGEEFAGDKDRLLAVWDAQSGRFVGRTKTVKTEFKVAQSDDARTILLLPLAKNGGGLDLSGEVLYRVGASGMTSGKLAHTRKDIQTVNAAVVSPAGEFVLAGFADGSLTLWGTANGGILAELSAGRSPIQHLAMSRDGRFIAAADGTNTVWIVDRNTGSAIASPTLPVSARDMKFAPQGDRLVVLTQDGTAYVIRLSPEQGMDGDAMALIDWGHATKVDEISAADRRRYGVAPPLPFERPDLAAIKPMATAPFLPRLPRADELAHCDSLAADPNDRDAMANGIALDALHAADALTACLAAMMKDPNDVRTLYQYGRALAAAKRLPEAVSYYKRAADGNYAAAARAIAAVIESDKEGSFKALGDPAFWYERAAEGGDGLALLTVAPRKGGAADDNATVQQVLSMALAAGWNRVSAAAMSVGQRIDVMSGGAPEQRKRALFYIEFGIWIADNVKQQAALRDDERSLRNEVTGRVNGMVKAFPAQDVVAIYRAARDWRPDVVPGSAAKVEAR